MEERSVSGSVAPRPWHLRGARSVLLLPVLAGVGAALSVWKPWEWYAPAFGLLTGATAWLPPARNRVRLLRAVGSGALVALALRHLLYVDQIVGGLLIVALTVYLLMLAFVPEREGVAVPLAVAFGVFLTGMVGLELRLFNTWPLSWLSVAVTLVCFSLLGRLVEHRGSAWTYRGAGAVALGLGQLFLALLFWPTAPPLGGAVLALTASAGMLWLSAPEDAGRRSARTAVAVVAILLGVLLVSARWT